MLLFIVLGTHFLRKLLSRVKPSELIDEEQEKENKKDQARYKKLKKKRLSPREEVLASYRLLHATLDRRYFVSYAMETPPPGILQDMWGKEKSLSRKSFFHIAQVFSATKYGDKDVNSEGLQHFRQHFKAVWSDITKGKEVIRNPMENHNHD